MESLLFNREFPKHAQAHSFLLTREKHINLFFCSILSKLVRALYRNASQIRSGRNTVFPVLPHCEADFHNASLLLKLSLSCREPQTCN